MSYEGAHMSGHYKLPFLMPKLEQTDMQDGA